MFNYEIENNEYDNLEECVNEVYELASKYAIDGGILVFFFKNLAIFRLNPG